MLKTSPQQLRRQLPFASSARATRDRLLPLSRARVIGRARRRTTTFHETSIPATARVVHQGDGKPEDDQHQQQEPQQQQPQPEQQQQPPLSSFAATAARRLSALARQRSLGIATAHIFLSNTLSLSILVLGVLSSTHLGPATAAPATALLLLANQASRPARLAVAVVLAPAADAAIDALQPLLVWSGNRQQKHASRLTAALALLCAQAALMLLALGAAALFALLATAATGR
jgi:hypothetical protein